MGSRSMAFVLLLGLFATRARAENAAPSDGDEPVVRPPSSYTPPTTATTADRGVPPLGAGRVLGEAALGGVFAVGGAIAGALIGRGSSGDDGCGVDLCLTGALLGGVAGLAVATPVGVYWVGSAGDQTGSFIATVGGSVLGTVAGIAVAEGTDGDAALLALVGGPVVGAMIGFNLTREYDPAPPAPSWTPVARVARGTASFGIAGTF